MNAPTPDALLLRLGARFDSAAAEEQEAWDKANEETGEGPWTLAAYKLAEVTSEVVDIIERIPATTHEGIMLKVRVLNWCRCWKVVAVKDFEPFGKPATETRVLVGMLNDLAAMARAGV